MRGGVHVDLGIDGIVEAEPIGAGSSATVYRARQPKLGRNVAVKVLSSSTDESTLRRFEREARALGSLSENPGIVTLYEAGSTRAGQPYLVMQYCDAGSLRDLVGRSGPLPATDVRRIGIEVATTLAIAHAQAITHRDLKPANLLLATDDRPLVADFGIASIAEHTTGASTGLSFTPSYAPPETMRGETTSQPGDVYSFGATLYHLLAGTVPFASTDGSPLNIVALARRIEFDQPKDLRTLGVPDAMAAVVEVAMSKDPVERPTMTELASMLTALELDHPATRAELGAGDAATRPAVRASPAGNTDDGVIAGEAPPASDESMAAVVTPLLDDVSEPLLLPPPAALMNRNDPQSQDHPEPNPPSPSAMARPGPPVDAEPTAHAEAASAPAKSVSDSETEANAAPSASATGPILASADIAPATVVSPTNPDQLRRPTKNSGGNAAEGSRRWWLLGVAALVLVGGALAVFLSLGGEEPDGTSAVATEPETAEAAEAEDTTAPTPAATPEPDPPAEVAVDPTETLHGATAQEQWTLDGDALTVVTEFAGRQVAGNTHVVFVPPSLQGSGVTFDPAPAELLEDGHGVYVAASSSDSLRVTWTATVDDLDTEPAALIAALLDERAGAATEFTAAAVPLEITNPEDGAREVSAFGFATGTTDPGATVLVDGKAANVDKVGRWSISFEPAERRQRIEIVATDRFGRQTSAAIAVRFVAPTPTPTPAPPATPVPTTPPPPVAQPEPPGCAPKDPACA
jgi:serine/threonine protein kinase